MPRDGFDIIRFVANGLEASTISGMLFSHSFDGHTTYDGRKRIVSIQWNSMYRRFNVTVSGGCRTNIIHLTSPTLVVRMIVKIDLLECKPSEVMQLVQKLVVKYNKLPDNGIAELSKHNNVTLCFS
jgi:hypothetical protein